MKTFKFRLVAIATLSLVSTSIGLDLRDVQEGSCDAIEDVLTLDDVDPTLVNKNKLLEIQN